jgi:hypothetical protein
VPDTSASNNIEVDVAVIGGGIAGLWLLNRLRSAGYSALLVEKTALGSSQTIASQGMIHGGLKYALAGTLTGAAESIKQMPQIWQQCLQGSGEIDLGDTQILSDNFYLWSAGNVGSRLVSFFASKSLRGSVKKIKRNDFPAPFANSPYKGTIYQLLDTVLDVPSLLDNLSRPHMPLIMRSEQLHWQTGDKGVELLHCDNSTKVKAQRYVVCAGEGSGEILAALNIKQPAMQLRPLQQVMVKHDLPYRLYGHCIGAQTSASPRLTVSTHPCRDGKLVWYLGGDLATEGVDLASEQLIDRARSELVAIFPWLDFSGADWATCTINRAEPLQEKLLKPDNAFANSADSCSNVFVTWPTKLTLAPDLAQQVLGMLQGQIQPQAGVGLEQLEQLPKPAIATPIWDEIWG